MKLLPVFLLSASALAAPLASYPTADRIKVGECLAKLEPAFAHKVEIPLPCRVKILFQGAEARLEKGVVWAEVDPERLALEERRFAANKAALDRKITNDAEAGLRKADIERRIQEVTQQLLALEKQDDSALGDIEGGTKFLEEFRKRTADTKIALGRQKELLVASLASFDGNRDGEIETARVNLAAQELELRRLRDISILRMPSTGNVNLLVEPDAERIVQLKSGQPLANVEDRSRFLLAVPVSTQNWRYLVPASLSATVKVPGGTRLAATWLSSESGKGSAGHDELAYVFSIAPAATASAARFGGGMVMAEIIHTPASPVHVVPKLAFAAAYPDAFKGGADWATAINAVWPGARLAVEGQSVLGVEAPGSAPSRVRR